MAAEAKRIAHCSTYQAFLGFVECEIQIIVNLGILVTSLMVDGRRNNIVLNSQYGSHSLNSAGGTQQVTRH